jgi:hypothetical protein
LTAWVASVGALQFKGGVRSSAANDPHRHHRRRLQRRTIVCKQCGRYGRHNVKRLIAAHGADATLPYLLVTLAKLREARSFSIYDRCKARFEVFSFRA